MRNLSLDGIYRWSYDEAQSMGIVAAPSKEDAEKIVADYITIESPSGVCDAELLEVWEASQHTYREDKFPNVADFYGL